MCDWNQAVEKLVSRLLCERPSLTCGLIFPPDADVIVKFYLLWKEMTKNLVCGCFFLFSHWVFLICLVICLVVYSIVGYIMKFKSKTDIKLS